MMRRQGDEESSAFYDLSALVLSLLRYPPMPIYLPNQFSDSVYPIRPPSQISPSGFASLLLGISVALMLCGSVTFFIGFLLLPWVLALIIAFYVAWIVSAISMAGRSILSSFMSVVVKIALLEAFLMWRERLAKHSIIIWNQDNK
ncbi:unnamed protein product, partial [Brassica rapa subsp. trilocularis]